MDAISSSIEKILVALGTSPGEVAETLKAQGIQGARNTVRLLNPIVRHVQGLLLISNLGMDVMKPDTLRITLLDHSTVETPLPQAVSDFLLAFNQGAYPDLEIP
jgi:hypothetical protein